MHRTVRIGNEGDGGVNLQREYEVIEGGRRGCRCFENADKRKNDCNRDGGKRGARPEIAFEEGWLGFYDGDFCIGCRDDRCVFDVFAQRGRDMIEFFVESLFPGFHLSSSFHAVFSLSAARLYFEVIVPNGR